MDVGVNRQGFRWVVEDERTRGQGFVARLWHDGRPTEVTARKGFTTREGAVEWATGYQGAEPSIAPILIEGFVFLFGFVVTATLIGAVIRGSEVRVTTRYVREYKPERPRGSATARPITR